MKNITTKFTTAVVASAFALVVALTGTALAIGEGQIEGGDIYRIKNLTKNTAFADPAFADKCETLQYKIRLHNPGPGVVGNVNVKVTLPSEATTRNVSTATITGENAQPATTSDTATLNISTSQKVSYVSGSTELLDTTSNHLSNLPDTITTTGVNVGDVGVSLEKIEFVQFKAKIDCPTPPCQPGPGQVVDTNGNCVTPPPKTPPTTTTTTTSPTKLVNTGPGEVAGLFAGVTAAGAAGYHMVLSRRFRDED